MGELIQRVVCYLNASFSSPHFTYWDVECRPRILLRTQGRWWPPFWCYSYLVCQIHCLCMEPIDVDILPFLQDGFIICGHITFQLTPSRVVVLCTDMHNLQRSCFHKVALLRVFFVTDAGWLDQKVPRRYFAVVGRIYLFTFSRSFLK